MLGFDFEIKYTVGKENKVADALYRRLQYAALTTIRSCESEGLEAEVQADERLRNIIQGLVLDPEAYPRFQLREGRLYYKGRLVIPRNSSRIPLILHVFPDSAVGGHSGFLRTYKRISGVLFWEGMKKAIQQYVASCDICQRNKYQTLSPAGLLQPLLVPSKTWSDITMDFIGGLPKTLGADTILVVVDRLTKYAHFLAIAHPYTTKDVAAIFVKEIVRLHGFPDSIITDRDRLFMSTFWTELFRLLGTKLKYSSAYHPQMDGQTGVTN